jgi:hypothetical protein
MANDEAQTSDLMWLLVDFSGPNSSGRYLEDFSSSPRISFSPPEFPVLSFNKNFDFYKPIFF